MDEISPGAFPWGLDNYTRMGIHPTSHEESGSCVDELNFVRLVERYNLLHCHMPYGGRSMGAERVQVRCFSNSKSSLFGLLLCYRKLFNFEKSRVA